MRRFRPSDLSEVSVMAAWRGTERMCHGGWTAAIGNTLKPYAWSRRMDMSATILVDTEAPYRQRTGVDAASSSPASTRHAHRCRRRGKSNEPRRLPSVIVAKLHNVCRLICAATSALGTLAPDVCGGMYGANRMVETRHAAHTRVTVS